MQRATILATLASCLLQVFSMTLHAAIINDGFELGDTSGYLTPGHDGYSIGVFPTGDAAGVFTLAMAASGGNGLIEAFQEWTQDSDAILTYYLKGHGAISAESNGFVGTEILVSDWTTFAPLSSLALYAQPTNNGLTSFDQQSYLTATVSLYAGKQYRIDFLARSWDGQGQFRDPLHTGTVEMVADFSIEPSATATVPEPASLTIWGGIGIAGLVAGWRRKRMQAASA